MRGLFLKITAVYSLLFLFGCKTVDTERSYIIDSTIEDMFSSAPWYGKFVITEVTKLAIDGHYYNRLGEAFVGQ